MTPLWFVALAGVGTLLTLALYIPPRAMGGAQLFYFLLTFLWGEFALYNILLQVLSLPLWYRLGAFDAPYAAFGLLLCVCNWIGLYVYHRIGHQMPQLLEQSLAQGLGQDYASRLPEELQQPMQRAPALAWLRPFPLRIHRCHSHLDLAYSDSFAEHKLDIYLPKRGRGPFPVVLYIHGGAFFMGDKQQQGRLFYQHAVDAGWAVVSVNYRLGPEHRMPAMIEDVKLALAWVREQADQYQLDAAMIVAAGESAGGLLALMLAATAGDRGFQPGFEQADVSVQGCISLYAPNDLLGLHGCFDSEAYQAFNLKHVMPVPADEDPDLWRRCSPMYRLHENMPPVFVLGGSHDCLASGEETRQLGQALGSVSRAPVVTAIYPYTTHAFDQTRSSRSLPTMQALVRFLAWSRIMSTEQEGD